MGFNAAVIDDLSCPHPKAANGAVWQMITDRVMGGISQGTMQRDMVAGRIALRMQGAVSLENNGGFVQMALDLAPDARPINACRWTGIEIDVLGNGARYNLHLRTADVTRPWQSYRHAFAATPEWQTHRLPFASFERHRIDRPLDPGTLRRLGLVAIGHAMTADLALGGVRFYA